MTLSQTVEALIREADALDSAPDMVTAMALDSEERAQRLSEDLERDGGDPWIA